MPGKYSHLKGKLTSFTPEPEYQARVNHKKDEIKRELLTASYPITVKTLGEVYARARHEKERLEDLVKAQNLIIEAMNQELVEMLEAQDFSNIKINTGVSLYIKDDVYCTVKEKPIFLKWIKDNGMEDLLSVNYQTMSALVRTHLQEGTPIPPGIDTYFKQSITMRGGHNAE